MLAGELRSQIDAIWNSFLTGGISNPLEVMEQITYLLFFRRQDKLRSSRFKNCASADMYSMVSEPVFPFLSIMGGHAPTNALQLKIASFSPQSKG